MIYYRDRTYCDGDGCKKFNECPSAATEEVEKAAEEFGLPISRFAEPKELSCYISENAKRTCADG